MRKEMKQQIRVLFLSLPLSLSKMNEFRSLLGPLSPTTFYCCFSILSIYLATFLLALFIDI